MNQDPPKRASITPLKNGPLKVSGLQHFSNSRGEAIAVKPTSTLCRCGASKRKPFCDGTHKAVSFTDEKTPDRVPDHQDEYAGTDVTVYDNRGTCSHAGFCTDNLPRVWRSGVEPWVDANAAPADDVTRVIRMCPSGALSYARGRDRETVFRDTPEIQTSRNGPYWVRGGVVLEGVEYGEGASREHYALCRCGHSGNKPFCDGSHWYAGFKDDEALTIAAANRAEEETADQWVTVGRAADFEQGQVHAVTAGNRTAALVQTEDG